MKKERCVQIDTILLRKLKPDMQGEEAKDLESRSLWPIDVELPSVHPAEWNLEILFKKDIWKFKLEPEVQRGIPKF